MPTRGNKRRSKKRKKKLARKRKIARKTARKEQQQWIEEKRNDELAMGYEADDQADLEVERRLDMMDRAQKRNARQRDIGRFGSRGQQQRREQRRGREAVLDHHKNKIYDNKIGGNTPKSKTRKSKTRKSKTPKKSKTRKSRLGPPPSTVPPPPPIIKCSAFNTEKRDHKKMLDKEERKRKKSRVSRKKRQEKKRVKDMTERVVCEVRRMFSKRTPSPYDFEKEMREWLEREERKRRRRRTRRRKGGRRRKKRGSRRKRRRTLRGGVWKNWHDSSKEIEDIEKKQDPKAHGKTFVGKQPAEEGIHFHGSRNNSWLRFKIAGKHYDLIEKGRLSEEQCHKAKAAAAEHAPWAVLMIDDIRMNWSGLVKELYQRDSDSEQEISLHGLFNHIGEENQDNLEEIKKREEEREKKKAQNQKLEEAIKQERLAAENRDKRLLARAGNTAGSSDARYLAHVQFARENKNRVKLVGLTKNNTKHNGKIVRIREVLKNGNFKVSFEGKHSAQGGGAVKTWEVKRQNLSPIISKSDHDKKQSYPRMPPVLVPERTGDGGWRISVRDVEEYIRNLNAHVLRYGRPPTKKIKSRLKLGTEVKALRWNKQTEQFELNILSNSPPKSKKGKKKGRRAQQHAAQPARGPPLGASGPCPGCGTMLRPPRGVREFVCSVCGVELFLEA